MAAFSTRDPGRAAERLRAGGLVVYPTETFYGLGALAASAVAVARLAAAKRRAGDMPLPLVAADLAAARAVTAAFPPLAERLAARFWPGPLTLVLPAAPGLPPEVAGEGTVGVRVPGSALARELSRLAGGPLVSTSANLSGGPPVTRPADLDQGLVGLVDCVLDGGETPGGLPSTVVAIEPGGPRLLRAGAVSWERLVASLAP